MSMTETAAHLAANQEEKTFLRHVMDLAEKCRRQNFPTCTNFLTEREQDLVRALLGADTRYVFLGGSESAERKLAYFLPDWLEEPDPEDLPVACLHCEWAAEYGSVGHRDLLGALMGLGLERDVIGDLYPGEGRADVVLTREILPYVRENLLSAGRVRLTAREIPLAELRVPERKALLVRDTVASLRLDAVVASGFGMAREKAADLIRAGRVQLDHLECLKPDKAPAEGSVVTVRGFGKLEVSEVGGLSRKGRICLVLKKYVG